MRVYMLFTCTFSCGVIFFAVFIAVMEDAGSDVRSKRLARLQQQSQPVQVTTPTPRAIPVSSKEPEVRQPVAAASTAAATTVVKPTATTPTKKVTDKMASPVKARIILACFVCLSYTCLSVCVSVCISTVMNTTHAAANLIS